MKMYFKGGSSIKNPKDLNGIEIDGNKECIEYIFTRKQIEFIAK